MTQIKIAIVGYGHIGQVHKNAVEQNPNFKLHAIVDPSQEIDEKEVKHYPSLEDFFLNDQSETQLVILSTPNGLHVSQAISCMEKGYHVLIEKPLALSIKGSEKLLEAQKKYHKRAFNTLQLRFSPVVQHVKELIENNALGEIYMVNTQCYWNRNKAYYESKEWHGTLGMDGGVLFTQFSHFADILHHLFGELKVTQSHAYNFAHQDCTEFPDSGKVDFTSPLVKAGHLIYTTATYPKNFESTITILAEKGTIQIEGQYMNQLSHYTVENHEMPSFEETKNFHPKALQEVYIALKENRISLLDIDNSMAVVRFIEAGSK